MAEDTQPHPKRCPCSACLERRRARTAAANAAPGRGLERHDPASCRCRYHVKARRVAYEVAIKGPVAQVAEDKGQQLKAQPRTAQLVDDAQVAGVVGNQEVEGEEYMPARPGASSSTTSTSSSRSADAVDQGTIEEELPPRCTTCGLMKVPRGYPEPELATFCSPYVSCPGYLAEPLPEAEWPNERQARAAQAAVAQLEQATEAQARRAHEVLVVERQRIRNAIILEDDRTMGEAMDDWQREDLEMLDRYETRHALLSRPRGHSKTGDAGSEAVVELLTGKDKVMLAYAADQEQATLLLNDVKAKLRRGGYVSDVSPRTAISKDAPAVWQPGDPIQVHIYQDRIVSTSGNVLTVEASDVSSSWGKRPDWVVCDELVEWRRPELWQAIWSATGKRPRSRVIVITTSGWDKSHFAWDVFEMARTEDDWYFSSRRQCASWIQPKWLEQQRRTMPEHVYKRLHENLWVDGFGAFLSSEEVERIFTLEIPPANAGRSAIGLDVGLTHDRTVLAAVRLFPQPKAAPLLYCDTLETWQGSRSNKVDLADVQRSAYEASIRWKAPVYADPHQAEQLIQNLVKLGRHAKAYTFTSASRRDLFAGLFAAIREGRLRCAPHEELRRELLGLEVQTTASGSYRVDHKAGRYDDHVIALSLAVHGALERQGSFSMMWGYSKSGVEPTVLFSNTPKIDGHPTTIIKEIVPIIIRCTHGFDVNGSSETDNAHRAECREGRRKHAAGPVPQAPTLRKVGTEQHQVTNPQTGRTEHYEDRRGLDAGAGAYEACGACGRKWPVTQSAERRAQHRNERQDRPSQSASERARNQRCRVWAGERVRDAAKAIKDARDREH